MSAIIIQYIKSRRCKKRKGTTHLQSPSRTIHSCIHSFMPPQSTMRPLSQITALRKMEIWCQKETFHPNTITRDNLQRAIWSNPQLLFLGRKKKFINNNFFQKKKNGPTRCPIHSMSDYPPPPSPPHRTGKSFPLLHAKRRYYQLDPADLDEDEMRKGEM